jgi:CRISPR-associated endonuclease Csn1
LIRWHGSRVNGETTPRSLLKHFAYSLAAKHTQGLGSRESFIRRIRTELMMGIRFSFDIGTNSIGGAVWKTGPDPAGRFGADAPRELLWAGVRIFKDGRNPKDGESLAKMRRVPKQARKRRDRFVLRRADLIAALAEEGLMPADESARKSLEDLDPYQLRAQGLNAALDPYHLGRAVFHLNQRRGFKSNRKTDKGDKDKGKIAQASKRLEALLKERQCRTFGEFLWTRHYGNSHDPGHPRDPSRQPTRIRLEGQGAKALYEFYPTRAMIEHEFDKLWETQAKFNPGFFTDAKRDRIRTIVFRQRDLKKPKVGRCTFEPEEERLPKALPSVEAREIYERLAHLRVSSDGFDQRGLTRPQRDALATTLLSGKNLNFAKIRQALKLPSNAKINFEEAGEEEFKGALSAKILSKPDHFGRAWLGLSYESKDAFVAKLEEEVDPERLVHRLMAEDGLSEAGARNCAAAPLADGYSRLGPTANTAILEALRDETDAHGFVVAYSEAVKRAGQKLKRGWHHSDERDGQVFSRLPYYGEVLQRHVLPGSMDPQDKDDEAAYWGRIMNPTVHIGLNQLRRLVNKLIERFGRPDQVVVELARELKLNKKQKDEEKRRNRDNRAANKKRAEQLADLQQDDRRDNLIRLRLFEEQATGANGIAACPYCGKNFGISKVFSDDIEVDHILPISKTLDDSLANRILACRACNHEKRGKSPFQRFGSTPEWPAILARSSELPHYRRWRFAPDAMKKFEGERDFLDRQLNETKYLSRLAKAYLGKVCNPNEVYVTPGKLVGLLRGKWGINELLPAHNRAPDEDGRKVRTDHRHHALDAIVIGALTRGLINYIAREAGRAEDQDLERVFGTIPMPFDGFLDAIRTAKDDIIVSNKPEHGKHGAMHEDTAYGIVGNETEVAAIGNLVYRKPVTDLTENEIDHVRDVVLRTALKAAVAPLLDEKGKATDKNAYAAALSTFAEANKVRRVRLGKSGADAIPIADRRNGKEYKALVPGENHHVDIVQMRDGTWRGYAATVFEVNRKDWRPSWERDKVGGKLVMRLHKGDTVQIDDSDGIRRTKTVHRIEISANRIRLAPVHEGGKLQDRHADKDDLFEWDFATISKLKERNCVAVRIDETGQVKVVRRNL